MGIKGILKKVGDALTVSKHTTAIILAAGSGERFSADAGELAGIKKQLVPVLGKPVILRTAEAFEASMLVDDIIVVSGEEELGVIRELLSPTVSKLKCVVKGGATRQESAMAGLEAVYPKTDYIAVHDGARCLITPEIIDRVIKEAYHTGAAAAAERAVDTVKYAAADGTIENTIDRDHVWLMKTPQIFMANLYRAAVYSAFKDGVAVTDDCMLAERLGFKVRAVDCGHENIKLTYAVDRVVAEAILAQRERKQTESMGEKAKK